MHQPIGFVNPNFLQYICKLHKSIYGLKHAPKAWFSKLSLKLLALGFHASVYDSSLFIFATCSQSIYVLIYADDIIVIVSHQSLIIDFISSLLLNFSIKDLDVLHFF